MWTLVLGDVVAVLLHNVYFHGAALGEARVAEVAFVGLLTCETMTKVTFCGGASPAAPLLPRGHPELIACLLFPGLLLQPLSPMITPN